MQTTLALLPDFLLILLGHALRRWLHFGGHSRTGLESKMADNSDRIQKAFICRIWG
jgi:hypothetical protein